MSNIITIQPAYSECVNAELAKAPRHFINGEWVASSHGETIPVYDPARGKVISYISDASENDTNRAVAAARAEVGAAAAAAAPVGAVAAMVVHSRADEVAESSTMLVSAHIQALHVRVHSTCIKLYHDPANQNLAYMKPFPAACLASPNYRSSCILVFL